MFRSLRRQPAPVTPTAAPPIPVPIYASPVAVAAPDELNQVRERSLRHQLGHGLQGGSGTIVGYDRGDPGHSVTGPVQNVPSPTSAYARLSYRDEQRILEQPQVYDQASTDPELDAYQASLLSRIGRKR